MTTYAIKNTETRCYVAADPNRGGSYTKYLQLAKTFDTREAAERDRCPGNEIVIDVELEVRLVR